MSSKVYRKIHGRLIESAWQRIRSHLETRRDQIAEEIRCYPKPIPACDVQFNTLLEERSKVARELSRLGELCGRALAAEAHIESIGAFIASSEFIMGDTEREIRSSFETEHSGSEE